ncbi:MAG: hypothetical protein EB096_07240, partial [Betaproteobacteria bacterium]|nr:hypothetical protein [Betaproteobacteria bacterium]
MAQSLGLPFQARWQASETICHSGTTQAVTAHVVAQSWTLGSEAERPFCFDNELSQHTSFFLDFEISLQPVNWSQYIQFVTATGYALPRYV